LEHRGEVFIDVQDDVDELQESVHLSSAAGRLRAAAIN
jgi:hypothetical protein